MKRLLLITYSFPPQRTAESFLVLRTMRALEKLGWDMTVLTVDEQKTLDPLDPDIASMVPSSAEIICTSSPERLLFSVPIVRGIIYRILAQLGLPETKSFWFFSALKAGKKLLTEKSFDVMHSWACYHTSNIVGLVLKRIFGLPWVVHFSDPWLDNPYFKPVMLQKRICRLLEEMIIKEADAVVFVTSQTADLVMLKYPEEWRQKVHVIPHGYDAELQPSTDISTHKNKKFRIVYTGSFYQKRTPEGIFKALSLLNQKSSPVLSDKLELSLIGYCHDFYKSMARELGLEKVVKFYGEMSLLDSMREAARADVLLVIDAPADDESIFLPCKLVDYLMFLKPILGLTPIRGTSAALLRRLDCPVVAPDDVKSIANVLSALLEQWEKGTLKISSEFEQVSSEYNINTTTLTLDALLTSVIPAP